MKEDLKMLIEKFLQETRSQRTEEIGKYNYTTKEPSFQDFINWLLAEK